MSETVEFVATNVNFCVMHWALPAPDSETRWCVSPDGNSRDCYFVQLFVNSYIGPTRIMGSMAHLSWYCDNQQHFQCDRYHPRVFERCQCQCHAEPAVIDGSGA